MADLCPGLWVFVLGSLMVVAAPDAATAEDPFERCWSRAAAKRSSCFYRTARRDNLWQEASAHLETLRQAEPDDPHLVDGLGRIALASGNAETATGYFARAAEAFAHQGETSREIFARINLSESWRLVGRLEEAAAEVETAIRLAEGTDNPELVGQTRIAGLRLSRHRGEDLESLRRDLVDLEEELLEDGDPRVAYGVLRMWHYDLGEILRRLHRLDEAQALSLRWAELARLHENTYDEATATANAATVASQRVWRSDALAETQRLAEHALDLAHQSGQPYAEAEALRLLGLSNFGEAGQSHLRQCLEKARPGSTGHVRCHFALAALLATDADQQSEAEDIPSFEARNERARSVLDDALEEVAASEDPWAAIYPWSERFEATWSTRSRDEALAESLAVLDLIETLRSLQISEDGRADFFASWVGAYHALVGRLLTAPDGPSDAELEAAFRISERMRARVLLDDLATQELATAAENGDPTSSRSGEKGEILRRIVQYQRQLQSPTLAPQARQLTLTGLEAAETDLAEVEERDVGPPKIEWAHELAELPTVQEALAGDEALFVFQLAPDQGVFGLPAGGSWLLVITRWQRQLHRLPSGPEIDAKVAMLLGLIEGAEQAEPSLVEGAASALYQDLLADGIEALPAGIERWIVAPDGVLHLLPFGLLAPRARLATVPSPTFWLRWRQAPEAPSAALAFADPATASAEVALSRFGELESGLRLGRLPHARREGEALVGRLGRPSRLLLGPEASEQALETIALDQFGLLHFAAHAVLDAERPYRSALLLSPGSKRHDGLLQPREIANLDLDGKLVVLSACQSAHGEAQLGEGAESLARAFFRAGARSVVASRWRLRDDDAAAFFDAFYAHLSRGLAIDTAVARARAQRRRSGASAKAWAGVVVLGDGAWAPIDTRRRPYGLWPWIVLPLLGALLVGLLGLRYGDLYRRRQH